MTVKLPPAVSTAVMTVKKISSLLERYRIRVYAAQASFFITISALPFLILLLTGVGFFLPRIEDAVLDAISGAVPGEFSDFVKTILDEISSKSSVSVASFSALTLLWSASKGIRSIGAGIANVYGGAKKDGFIGHRVKAVGFTLLWMLTVLMTLGIWVFGDIILSYSDKLSSYGIIRLLNGGAFLIILTAVFAATFTGYSGRQVKFFAQLPGAVFAAVGWFLYSSFFEFYIENFADYSYIYGSLTSLVVIMLWLYSCMEILLIGAGINRIVLRLKDD